MLIKYTTQKWIIPKSINSNPHHFYYDAYINQILNLNMISIILVIVISAEQMRCKAPKESKITYNIYVAERQ